MLTVTLFHFLCTPLLLTSTVLIYYIFTVWSVFVFYVVFWVLFFLVSPAVVYFEFLNKVVWYGKI